MKKHEEYLVYTAKDGREIRFPVVTIEGAAPGPHMVITAGIHGGEYPPTIAAIEFYKTCNPAEISGTITIVTVSNLPAFENRTMFVTPIDGKNPNHIFPGSPEGSYSENLVHYLFRDVISKADFHLDLHCGDIIETLTPFAEYAAGLGDEETERKSRELAYYYGLPYCVGTMYSADGPCSGQCYENSGRNHIASALAEVGSHGQLDRPSVETHLRGIKNVLRHFGMLTGEAFEPQGTEFFSGFEELFVPQKGIFYYDIQAGDRIVKGQKLGHLEDYFGHFLCDVTSPGDGLVIYITDNPSMFEDNFIGDMAVK